ncbi:MAG: hypothetical protein U7123_22060 [Potamolinea sp.]
MSFQEFKQKYTIDPTEAKQLEEQKKTAFPNVEYAVVEYPLAVLEKGIEIVDSPGLKRYRSTERNVFRVYKQLPCYPLRIQSIAALYT